MRKFFVVLFVALAICGTVFAQGAAEAKKSDKVTLTVLNYIDMSEPNSANEIAKVFSDNLDLRVELCEVIPDLGDFVSTVGL